MLITIRNRWLLSIFWHRAPWKCPRFGVTASHKLWFHWFTNYLFQRKP